MEIREMNVIEFDQVAELCGMQESVKAKVLSGLVSGRTKCIVACENGCIQAAIFVYCRVSAVKLTGFACRDGCDSSSLKSCLTEWVAKNCKAACA